jgi:hypothetical protein
VALYLVPATRTNLASTIEKAVAPTQLVPHVPKDIIAEIQARAGMEGIRCWAMTSSLRKSYDAMRPGDIVLLSETGTGHFTHYAQVTFKWESKTLGDSLWSFKSEKAWELIYFLRNLQPIRILKSELVTKFNYRANFDVPGTTRVSEERIQFFEATHGPVEAWFGIPSAYEEVTSFLGELHDAAESDYSASDVPAVTKRRQEHARFAAEVKTNYGRACAMCGVTEQDLLVAGHIVAWSVDKKNRLNPANGLCLCVLHDRAFERGYLVLDDGLFIRMNPRVSATSALGLLLKPVDGLRIRQPRASPPAQHFLKQHRDRFPF